MKRKVLALTLLGAAAAAGTAFAIEQDIDIIARLRVGLAFSNEIDMNFTPGSNHLDYYGTPSASDYVTMGTNGAMVASTAVFQPSTATGTPGAVDVTGDGTSAVYVTCTVSATMAEPSATTIDIDQLELQMDTGTAFQTGSPYACAGIDISPFTPTLTGSNTILMGGRLVGNATIHTALYSTANTGVGGVPATVKVIYQ